MVNVNHIFKFPLPYLKKCCCKNVHWRDEDLLRKVCVSFFKMSQMPWTIITFSSGADFDAFVKISNYWFMRKKCDKFIGWNVRATL